MTFHVHPHSPVGQILHHLLSRAALGMVTRDRNGIVRVGGATANLLQTGGVSVLDRRGWLGFWTEPTGDRCYYLTEAGTETLDRWDASLWGPPGEPLVSSKPLIPPCLADDAAAVNVEAQRLISTVFPEETP